MAKIEPNKKTENSSEFVEMPLILFEWGAMIDVV